MPQVSLLYNKLCNNNINSEVPLTVEEAHHAIKGAMGNAKITVLKKDDDEQGRPEKNPILITEKLNCVYQDGTQALKDINLSTHDGDFIAFIGQNGSGKTTLAKHFAGLLKATEGDVVVRGKNTRDISHKELALWVGYVFQDPDRQLFSETVENEIAYGPRNFGISEKEVKERIEESLEATAITKYRKRHPFSLCKAEKQRVALASILAMRPDALVIDEPTTGQDRKISMIILDFLKKLNKEGKTIIIISHNMQLVAEYAKRMVVVNKGRILLNAPTRHAFTKHLEMIKGVGLRPLQITELSRKASDFEILSDVLKIEEIVFN